MANDGLMLALDVESDLWTQQEISYEQKIANLTKTVLRAEAPALLSAKYLELSVVLTNNAEIQKLNKRFRGKDKPTDTLSFPGSLSDPLTENSEDPEILPIILGDIVLAYETMTQDAADFDLSFHDHFSHIVVHSLLHLLGHDHEDPADAMIMEQKEIQILSTLGIENPYEQRDTGEQVL